MITITPTDNGAVVNFGDGRTMSYVFNSDTMNDEELDHDDGDFTSMLYEIAYILRQRDKFAERGQVDIQIAHGDKYECEKKNCKICERYQG